MLYSTVRENLPTLFRILTSSRAGHVLAYVNYDAPLNYLNRSFLRQAGVDLSECVEPSSSLDTPRKVFERKIRYWECRPMPQWERAVVSPADSRVLIGSLDEDSALFIKEKFFRFEELIGQDKPVWLEAFAGGDFAVFRLTPDKYHYNHTPVAGTVVDIYEVTGEYHSCNPGAVVTLVTPYSKNRRIVTIIDTDVEGGSHVGLVAMIEIVALMIGDIVQVYSERHYDDPRPVTPGLFVRRGAPKSLYRPGSSTDVLLFQRERIRFAPDLVENLRRPGVTSRFSRGFSETLVETELKVRSLVAEPLDTGPDGPASSDIHPSRLN